MTLDAHTAATVNAVRRLALLRAAALLGGTAVLPGWALSELDATQGLRAALERGASSAVSLLGRDGGFLNNPLVHIALPEWLNQGARLLRTSARARRSTHWKPR